MSKDLTEAFKRKLEKQIANLERIESRSCSSDNYNGIEYEFYGPNIPTRPIIDVVSEEKDQAIESMVHVNERNEEHNIEPRLVVFIADLSRPEQLHPAFTAERVGDY